MQSHKNVSERFSMYLVVYKISDKNVKFGEILPELGGHNFSTMIGPILKRKNATIVSWKI